MDKNKQSSTYALLIFRHSHAGMMARDGMIGLAKPAPPVPYTGQETQTKELP